MNSSMVFENSTAQYNASDNSTCMEPTMTGPGVISLLVIPFSIFGILANITSLLVFSQYKRKTTSVIGLMWLSCVYVFLCFILLLTPLVNYGRHGCFKSFFKYHGYVFVHLQAYFNFFKMQATWILAYLALERLIAVKCPTKFKTMFNRKRIYIYIFVLVLGSVAVNIPRAFTLTVIEVDNACLGSLYKYASTAFGKSSASIVVVVLNFTLVIVGPCLAIGGLTLALVIIMSKKDKVMAINLTTQEHRIMKSVVIVLIISTICCVPDVLSELITTLKLFARGSVTLEYIYALASLVNSVDASVNIVIFSLIGKQFRNELRKLCGKLKFTGPVESSSSQASSSTKSAGLETTEQL